MSMAQRSKPVVRSSRTLAALLGVAVVSTLASTASGFAEVPRPQRIEPAIEAELTSATPVRPSLGEVIESRLERAHQAGRGDEIDQLGSLWLTLQQRGQLARCVDHGEAFVGVSLRNERINALRRQIRQDRFVPTEDAAVAALAESLGTPWGALSPASASAPDEQVEVAELIDGLDEPYRTAVALSLDGLSRREVAEQMDVTPEAVRKWMQRLRERWSAWAV